MRPRSAFLFSSAALAAAIFVGTPTTVDAAGIACTAAVASKVTPSTACQMGGTNNDFLNPLQVNGDGLFGFNDWKFGEKALEEGEQAVDLGFQVSGGLLSGTWSINSNIWSGITHLMIVLKGSAAHKFSAYLIEVGATSGTYSSPFANWKGKPQEISHISVYYRAGTQNVPEPQLLLLFGVGLLVISRRFSTSRRPS